MRVKRGQVTVFIIIAIVLVIGVGIFFAFKDKLLQSGSSLPADLQPVYTSFLNCIKDKTLVGVSSLETQGGYIYLPDFEAGSAYSPFSSQLIFAGNPIPYWYYVSGNNLQKEQVPSKAEMQSQLAQFIEEKVYSCNFNEFYEQGYAISLGEPKVETIINNDNILVNVKMDLGIERANDSAIVSTHNIQVDTQLGTLYNSAKSVYDYEQQTLFLENYAVDTLRNYAPVDGIELQCSPKVWNAEDIFDEIQSAIELNTMALRGKNNDFDLTDKSHKYFVVDVPVKEKVYFVNSQSWPSSFEVNPAEGAMLIAKPVGNQEGMGILGFCYVPYHFIYSVKYPVLIQVVSGDLYDGEIFQFPVAIVVDKNRPRVPYSGEIDTGQILDFCNYKNTQMTIGIYDINLNPVDAQISYSCSETLCDIGKSKNGILIEDFPQCINGYITAKADGYEEQKEILSTTTPSNFEIFLTPYYSRNVNLKVDNADYKGEAIVSFINLESGISRTVLYPTQKTINLSRGQYEIQVYIYKNTSINLPESVSQQCMEVPRSGLGGLFGLTEEKCYDITIPAQIISNALYGGGKQDYYILDEELRDSNTIEINSGALPVPKTLDQLQTNYFAFEEMGLEVNFK